MTYQDIQTLATIIYETSEESDLADFLISHGYYCIEEALISDEAFRETCNSFYITNLI